MFDCLLLCFKALLPRPAIVRVPSVADTGGLCTAELSYYGRRTKLVGDQR